MTVALQQITARAYGQQLVRPIFITKGGTGMDMEKLWEQHKGLISLKARGYFVHHQDLCQSAGVALEDLVQEGYFALVDAAKAWTPESGYKLTSFLKFPLLNRFRAALGIKTEKRDMLNFSDSLDRPLPSCPEITVGDSIVDPEGEQGLTDCVDSLYQQQLHNALEDGLRTLPDHQAEIIRDRYYREQTLTAIAAERDCTSEAVRQHISKAISKLRRRRDLRAYREDIISRHAYLGSFGSFRSRCASSVEFTVELMELHDKPQGGQAIKGGTGI